VAYLRDHQGQLDLTKRFELAQKAFAHTAAYDSAIAAFLSQQNPGTVPSIYDLA